MIEIAPKKITGQWDDGYALDFHTLSSEYLGDDEYGHPQFSTIRSPMGELLYRLKYGRNRSVIVEIVTSAAGFVASKPWAIDLVVPVPPSRLRGFQPAIAIAERLAEKLSLEFCGECVTKIKEIPELKNTFDYGERSKLLSGAFRAARHKVEGKSVLLFDDLYRSGATMNAVASELNQSGGAAMVCALTLTMTRSHR